MLLSPFFNSPETRTSLWPILCRVDDPRGQHRTTIERDSRSFSVDKVQRYHPRPLCFSRVVDEDGRLNGTWES
jgi:hypothetical protein